MDHDTTGKIRYDISKIPLLKERIIQARKEFVFFDTSMRDCFLF